VRASRLFNRRQDRTGSTRNVTRKRATGSVSATARHTSTARLV
jgi:hypothetical protein